MRAKHEKHLAGAAADWKAEHKQTQQQWGARFDKQLKVQNESNKTMVQNTVLPLLQVIMKSPQAQSSATSTSHAAPEATATPPSATGSAQNVLLRAVEDWGVQDLCLVLCEWGLSDYTSRTEDEAINGGLLLALEDQYFIDNLGFTPAHMRKLRTRIELHADSLLV
jgi:hypothetical protein